MGYHRRHNGQSLIEFALLLPILLIILVILADMGRAIAAHVCLSNAAREGVRYAADNPLDYGGIKDRVLLEYNNTGIRVTGMELLAEDILITYPNGTVDPGNPVRVAMQAHFPLFFGSFFPAGIVDENGAMLIEGSAQMVIF